jgi:hypothetical protein
MNNNHHGYYWCGNQKFYNKFQAILYAEAHGCGVEFYFNDHVFSMANWTEEPTVNLDNLYARRARELREQYDYLVIHFSGGYDSGNILETFVRNNIPVDEIYIRGSRSTSIIDARNHSGANSYAEIDLIARPLAEFVKQNYMPHVKITIQDTVDHIIQHWARDTNWIDNLDVADFSPSTIIKKTYDELNPEFKKMTDRGLKVAHVMGMEKPDMYYQDGKYYVRFLDKFSALHTPVRSEHQELPLYREPFYWSPSCAEMIIKQCHLIKRHIKTNCLDPAQVFSMRGTAKHHFLGNIIYNRTWPLPFYPDKSLEEIRESDYFFFKDPYADHYLNWKKGIDHIRSILPNHWKHNTVSQGTVGIYSKSYCIGI